MPGVITGIPLLGCSPPRVRRCGAQIQNSCANLTRVPGCRYDAKADLWSVGTIFFELVTGRPPFTGANYMDLTQNILNREAAIPTQVSIAQQCVSSFFDIAAAFCVNRS